MPLARPGRPPADGTGNGGHNGNSGRSPLASGTPS
jgi:hypothetical protein